MNFHFQTRRQSWQCLLTWFVATAYCLSQPIGESAAFAAEEAPVVQLIVDYGDGSQKHFTRLEWKDGMTVLAAVQLAAKHPRGIKPAIQGSGELTLLISIDDLKNEGNGKNWLYRVNGKLADRSCGIMKLSAGDIITWQFSAEMP